MIRKKLTVFLITLTLLGVYFLTSGTGDPTSITDGPPDDPWLYPGNGEKINITAGNRTQIRTTSGNQIQICTNESVKLQINESDTNPAGSLPNKTRAVNRYMHIELNGTVAMNATLCRNYTNSELNGLGNVSTFRWAYYNTSKFQWEYAHQNWVEITSEGASVRCNTSHFSLWTILAAVEESPIQNPNPGTPFECKNGTGFAVQAGSRYQIKTQSGFSLELKLNQSSEITVTEYEESPKVMTKAQHHIRTQAFKIELNNSAQIQANFSYKISNKNQYGIKNMEKLKFMFYNESSKDWEAPKHQWLEGDTLYCNTTHFSLWTIVEEETTDSSTPGFTILPLILFGVVIARNAKKRK
ncbi:MAG: hypothetical protein JSW11_08395 [Candidatus Heimdallarchaeota archaeon]|nr:MAG: hypothetical protein JSW11_08395 [Candidatus Heimdallarchaeota archaeon]